MPNCHSGIGYVDAPESFGSSGMANSMVGMALVDEGGDPSKRKAARVSWNPSISEFIANEEGEGAETLGKGAS